MFSLYANVRSHIYVECTAPKSLIINLSVLVILMLSGNQRDVLPPRYRVFGTNRKLTARPKC